MYMRLGARQNNSFQAGKAFRKKTVITESYQNLLANVIQIWFFWSVFVVTSNRSQE